MLEPTKSTINDISQEPITTYIGSNIILLMGAPLSGKGTQSKLLEHILNRPAVSSGDLLRAEVATGSELGKQMKAYMDAGELIPNELTTTFLTTKLSDSAYKNGMILDGYPRNLSHLEIFDNILINLNRSICVAIYLDVSKSELDQRRLKRNRTDDYAETFEKRYRVFQEETLPLIKEFEKRSQLIHIACHSDSPEDVQQNILAALNAHLEPKHVQMNCNKVA